MRWNRGSNARYQLALWVMLIPFLGGTVLLVLMPMLMTVGLAFTEYDVLSPPRWRGFESFAIIARRDLFWIAVRNS
ncbi:MAG: sugar ABC transporter permease, partial [Caldilineaceae bacterium]|nr:sugar ABC transporter permease [Caldilineaceae bacterium]